MFCWQIAAWDASEVAVYLGSSNGNQTFGRISIAPIVKYRTISIGIYVL